MKKSLMILICAGIVVLALLVSIIVAHGKISSTERKLSLCNDELNKVSEQLKELKEYTANETFVNQKKDGETTTADEDGENGEYNDPYDYKAKNSYDDDDDDYTTRTTTYYYRTTSTSTTTKSSQQVSKSTTAIAHDSDEDPDDADYD